MPITCVVSAHKNNPVLNFSSFYCEHYKGPQVSSRKQYNGRGEEVGSPLSPAGRVAQSPLPKIHSLGLGVSSREAKAGDRSQERTASIATHQSFTFLNKGKGLVSP